MFPLFRFNEIEMLAFALVLLRMASFIVSWPVFSVYSVPGISKVLFALTLAILVFPTVSRSGLSGSGWSNEIIWLALKEVFIGLMLGFVTRLFFFTISIAGNIIATSMGLANGQIFNPTLNMQSTTVEQFFVVLATLFFLTINGHHLFLTGLVQSFEVVPLSLNGIQLGLFSEFGKFIQDVVSAGIKLASPVMVSIFFMNIVMGVVGRAVPQINVLITSMPVNVLVGFGVMTLMIPLFLIEMTGLLNVMASELFKVMKAF